MKVVGIIAEFNPMHKGHNYLIKKAKEITGADVCICIMSGNFTQNGNISVLNKFIRAKTAIKNGIDVIIELPVLYATASTQHFCYGAVKILNSLNCIDYLCFGSETGNIDELKEISNILIKEENNIWNKTAIFLKEGISFASARQRALESFLTPKQIKIATTSNNILALEYIKSLTILNSKIEPIAIKRKEGISSTNIRELIKANKLQEASLLTNEKILNTKLAKNNDFFKLMKYNIVSNSKDHVKEIREVTEGLENSIISNISITNYDEYIEKIKSKRYQMSKIKRMLLNILLDISKEEAKILYEKTEYAHIIAIKEDKKNDILSLLNKKSSIPIITSINENIISKLSEENKQSLILDIKANNIYNIIVDQELNKDYTNKL